MNKIIWWRVPIGILMIGGIIVGYPLILLSKLIKAIGLFLCHYPWTALNQFKNFFKIETSLKDIL